MECAFCGHTAESVSAECSNCGASTVACESLSQDGSASGNVEPTSLYDKFANRVQEVLDGSLSHDSFLEWLQTMQTTLAARRDNYVELIKNTGYYEFGSDEVDLVLEGMHQYEEAMGIMSGSSTAGKSFEQECLERALPLMWNGNTKMERAMQLNRQTNTPEESYRA